MVGEIRIFTSYNFTGTALHYTPLYPSHFASTQAHGRGNAKHPPRISNGSWSNSSSRFQRRKSMAVSSNPLLQQTFSVCIWIHMLQQPNVRNRHMELNSRMSLQCVKHRGGKHIDVYLLRSPSNHEWIWSRYHVDNRETIMVRGRLIWPHTHTDTHPWITLSTGSFIRLWETKFKCWAPPQPFRLAKRRDQLRVFVTFKRLRANPLLTLESQMHIVYPARTNTDAHKLCDCSNRRKCAFFYIKSAQIALHPASGRRTKSPHLEFAKTASRRRSPMRPSTLLAAKFVCAAKTYQVGCLLDCDTPVIMNVFFTLFARLFCFVLHFLGLDWTTPTIRLVGGTVT